MLAFHLLAAFSIASALVLFSVMVYSGRRMTTLEETRMLFRIGPIGGIRQKLWGAKDAGADWFLAPESNCDEVVGHVPDGLQVFSVGTLDDALDALEAVRDGGDVDALPTCTAAS